MQVGEGLIMKEFENFSDYELSWMIWVMIKDSYVLWDREKTGRAVAELDRRLNHS